MKTTGNIIFTLIKGDSCLFHFTFNQKVMDPVHEVPLFRFIIFILLNER